MIIDLERFIAQERRTWTELESILDRLEKDAGHSMDLDGVKRFHYLYQRTSADLAKIMTFSSEPNLRLYLETLVARAYGEIHETREKGTRLRLPGRFFVGFPRTVRAHAAAFWLAVAITLAGCAFGGLSVTFDRNAREALIPFAALHQSPSRRVATEENATRDRLEGKRATFSGFLMTHNIKVSILLMALGMTWGIGTVLLLFSNGVMLGAVTMDYILAGQTKFMVGWLLPHGAVEIPAFLIAGQAGFLLAGALIGWGDRTSLRSRFRQISGDLVLLMSGVAILLVWAGFIEAFLSQYHEPVIPYVLKIAFGVVELVLLSLFLGKGGTRGAAGGAG